ncbi:MAG TPA: DUF2182 domain-containing protein [Thermoleophilaceae bacterium]|nr:DUF2182 domain-containing protein [Thermoleophilaceae bacterium]
MRATRAAAGVLVALAVACWWITARRMGGMAIGPTVDLGSLGFYTSVWVVMMAAMMFPSAWPVVGAYDRVRIAHGAGGAGTPLVVGGYLAAWTLWGVAAYGVIALAHSLFGDFLPWDGAGRWVAAGVVLAAAAYQLTPLKDACLARCRIPIVFVVSNWRAGRYGAFRLGATHGAWCAGCCWGLMATLFALGVMSVGWMVFIAALIAVEKLWPSRLAANWSVTAVLLVVGVALLAHPAAVPGMPDAGAQMHMQPMNSMR